MTEFQILYNLEKQLLFLGNRRSQYKCNAECVDSWGVQEIFLHYIHIHVYINIYRDNSNRKSSNSNSGCSLREVCLDVLWTDIFWH